MISTIKLKELLQKSWITRENGLTRKLIELLIEKLINLLHKSLKIQLYVFFKKKL